MRKFIFIITIALLLGHVVSAQFPSVTNLTPLSVTTNTKEKPQSKAWIHDGKHWSVLSDTDGAQVFRLDGTTWTRILTIHNKNNRRADCKVDGNLVHIFLFRPGESDLVSIEYVPASSTYKRWTGRTSTVRVPTSLDSETGTIDIDSQGKMWMAYDDNSNIMVRWSNSPYTIWSDPVTIASGVHKDDIGAVIAMPMLNQVGVLWSNQVSRRFGFKTHTDGADPNTWSADEVPASQSALNIGSGMADDHMNMALGSNGTLYCAVKTSYDKSGYPRISLIIRRPGGSWDNLYGVSETGTRGIALLNEQSGKIRVVYAANEDSGDILYRESALSPIAFGPQLTLISGTYNNPTSIKSNFTGQVVIIASNTNTAVGVLATDNNTPPPPSPPGTPSLSLPINGASGIVASPTLSWNAASNAITYQVQLSTAATFTSLIADTSHITGLTVSVANLNTGTKYFWRVRAVNNVGPGNWSSTWSFTTSGQLTSLVGHWQMEDPSVAILSDASGYGNHASTIGNPVFSTGIYGQALQLNGSNQYASAPTSASLNVNNAITLAAWIKPERTGARQVILKKGLTEDGYELSVTGTRKVTFRFNQETAGNNYQVVSSGMHPIDGQTWMHIAATFDGTTISVYLDGVLDKALTLSSPATINSNSQDFTIGAQSNGSSRLQGAIDDARVYNVGLTAQEINALAGGNAINASSQSLLATPNPFRNTTDITFTAPVTGDYTLMLYNISGQPVKVLKQGNAKEGEKQLVQIKGDQLRWGLYLVRLQTKSTSHILKVMYN